MAAASPAAGSPSRRSTACLWADPAEARRRLNPAQSAFVDRLLQALAQAEGAPRDTAPSRRANWHLPGTAEGC